MADRDDVVEVRAGVVVADPYRYLEDPDADRTKRFVEAQNLLSAPYLAELPGRAALGRLVEGLLTEPRSGVPFRRGGHYFRFVNPGNLDQDRLSVADSLADLVAGGRVLVDPNTWSADGTAALGALSVTKDGNLLAYTRSEAGSDWTVIRFVDVRTGVDLPDELRWVKFTEPTWLPDRRSLLYWTFGEPQSLEDTTALGAGRLMLHRLGEPQSADRLVWEPTDPNWGVSPWVADDGRHLVLTCSPGTESRSVVIAYPLESGPEGWTTIGDPVPVVTELADAHHPVAAVGDLLYLRTERDAPTGALVRVDLADPAAPWTEVVRGTAERVLAWADPVPGGFLLLWSVDASHRVELFADAPWEPVLGKAVSVTALNAEPDCSEVFVGVTSFTERQRVFRLDLAAQQAEELPAASDRPALPPATARRVRATSTDGAAVPMTLVARDDLGAGPHPVLLYGYGGFDIPVLPAFSAMFAGWVAAGGVLAVANLRGGGEFGARWHEQGMTTHKQQVFDDLFACAERLIADGTTTARQLAVFGRSNGGLLVGAAITQRPELFAAALPTVGVLDMLRFHLFTIGRAWTVEYGDPDDPADFPVLLAYSPLHRLTEGTGYPATLICTGDHDDRVVPAHSLKFGAQLQHCQAGSGPVLLRVDTRAGHGAGKPVTALAAEYADQLAFAAAHTGLTVADPPR